MSREFKIIEVKEIKTQDGETFNAFKTVDKTGKKMDVSFTRDCDNIPTEPCIIVVPDGKCNVDISRRFPRLWVKEVEEIKELAFVAKDNVMDYFD